MIAHRLTIHVLVTFFTLSCLADTNRIDQAILSFPTASAQTIRERLKKDPDFRIYGVIFGITVATNSAPPIVRLDKVIDPKSGTTDAVKIDVPEAYIKAAKKKIEAKHYEPTLKDGKSVEFFTYFLYVPGHSNVVVVDLDKPLDKQP